MPASAQGFLKPSHRLRSRKTDLAVWQCSRCGLVQLASRPVSYYRSVLTAAGLSEEMKTFRQAQLLAFVEEHALAGRRILEFGCGEGHLLDLLVAAGARATGLEWGEAALAAARKAHRDVLKGYAADGEPEAAFDAFICINFLEHAPRPDLFLAGLARWLKPGAFGLVEVPSFDAMVARRRFFDFIPDHLSYFSERTLSLALEAAGFEVLECSPVWKDYDLAATVRLRVPMDLSDWVEHHPVVRALARILEDSASGRVAVWGASHQGMALVSRADHRRIQCIFDSSPAKQHRCEPTTLLRILPPAELNEQNIQTVIVLAAGYAPEIIAALKGELGFRGRIFALLGDALEQVP